MATRTFTAGIATLSWIDPKTGLPEVDKKGDPGAAISRSDIKEGKLYRFANFLEAFVVVNEQGRIVRSGFTGDSEMYRGPSAFGLDSAVVGKIGRSSSTGAGSVTFRQLVGCRTVSPEKIGAGGGAVAGAAAGAAGVWAGAKLGVVAGSWAGPVGMLLGAVTIGAVGYFTGREVAELVSAFPPIWTELELTLFSDGGIDFKLVSHSLFPSNTLYALPAARGSASEREVYGKQAYYDGNQNRLKDWKEQGWGLSVRQRSGPTAGNPWGMSDPGKVLGGGSLSHDCPLGYQCG